MLVEAESPELYWSSHPPIGDCHPDTGKFPMNRSRRIGRNGNAKSTGSEIETGENIGVEAMRKSREGTKGTGNTNAEEADELLD